MAPSGECPSELHDYPFNAAATTQRSSEQGNALWRTYYDVTTNECDRYR
jgi:hypothetical protein